MGILLSALAGSCAPVTHPEGGAIAGGAVLAFGTLLIPIPQALKVLQQKSSAGISVPTLWLTILFGCANIGSTVAVKWRTIESCSVDAPACLGGLLDLLQQIASAASWLTTLACVISFPPARTRHNVAATAALLVASSGIVGAGVGVAASQPCSTASLGETPALC